MYIVVYVGESWQCVCGYFGRGESSELDARRHNKEVHGRRFDIRLIDIDGIR
jgi:hypothetical protein